MPKFTRQKNKQPARLSSIVPATPRTLKPHTIIHTLHHCTHNPRTITPTPPLIVLQNLVLSPNLLRTTPLIVPTSFEQFKGFAAMWQDHFIVYPCGHTQYLEFEACPLYQKALRQCKKGKEKVVEHSSRHNCRECRSGDEKEARDQFRAANRRRFKYEV